MRHNGLSFALANMMATTMLILFRSFAVQTTYLRPVIVSGMVTFVAAYQYVRILNSWVDAYDYATGSPTIGRFALQPCLLIHGLAPDSACASD